MTMLLEFARTGATAGTAAAVAVVVGQCFSLARSTQWAAAIALGYVAGHVAVTSGGGWADVATLVRPREARDWLPLAVLAAAVVAIASSFMNRAARDRASRVVPDPGPSATRAGRRLLLVIAALLCIGVPIRLLAGSVYVLHDWSMTEKLFHLVGLAVLFSGVWYLLANAPDDDQPAVRTLLFVIVTVAIAVTLTLAGTIVYGQLCTAVAASLGGASIAHYIPNLLTRAGACPTPSPALSATAGPLTMALASMIMLGHYYAELTLASAALLVLALVAAGGRLPAMNRLGPTRRAAVRGALALLPASIALAVTYAAISAEPASPY